MSLKRITLKDFVIVKHLELELSSGFSVLSGETGAGKSILIDAIQLALGARAETSVIREGASKAEITLEFSAPPFVAAWLEEEGFGLDKEQSELLVRRVIEVGGKSRAWINASPATASQLKELSEQLIDIHGQHAWQSLTRPNSVRILLDAYAGISTAPLSKLWSQLKEANQTLSKAKEAQEKLLTERERLMWQLSEVEKLAPKQGEWIELNAQHARLANAQTLIDVAQKAIDSLQGEDTGADQLVAAAQSTLDSNSHLESEFAGLSDTLASANAQIADVAHSLHSWLKRTDLDPEKLSELDERLSLWLSLARRYKRSPEELPELYASWKSDLEVLERAVDLEALEHSEREAQKAYNTAANQISHKRAQTAPLLSEAITEAMQGLGMQGGRFLVQIEKALTPSSTGVDEISFLVAAHSGSTPRPVAKVASGGELSRISLAIAVTTSQLGEAQTLIFDEVDSGIGGAVAQTVGRLMKKLGIDRQVLAVTHLPQVAACADHHWVVSKSAGSEGTLSQIHSVEGSERVNEIARMLGGERITETTKAHAKEMLEQVSLAKVDISGKAKKTAQVNKKTQEIKL